MTSQSQPDNTYPRLTGTREIYSGRVISLRVDEIEWAEGLNVRREVVSHPGAVVILPVDADGRILWVRQHRWAAGRSLLELPAGTLEPNETPENTARREICEEVGFAAARWELLGRFFTAPGFCTEYMYAFLATELTPEEAEGDEDEDITVETLTLEESLVRIDAGEVEDAKSLATMMFYLRRAR